MPLHDTAVTFLGLALLGGLLAAAVWHDIASLRVPNAIVLTGTICALAFQAFVPAGAGAAGIMPVGLGFLAAAGGLLVGLGLLLPLYLLRAAGAGDVKLMGMAGAFLGPVDAIGAVMFTGIAGAMLAVAVAYRARAMRQMLANLRFIAYSLPGRLAAAGAPSFDPRKDTVARTPYSVAIAAGTAAWLAVRYSY